jgi:hypothetical protein
MKITTLKEFIKDYYIDDNDFISQNRPLNRYTLRNWVNNGYRVMIYKDKFEIIAVKRANIMPEPIVSIYHDVKPVKSDWMDF